MKKISLLSISNSFGVNLQKYASQIAKENGMNLDIFVLYIGGCSLETHAKNILSNSNAYDLYKNGEIIKGSVSIKETLDSQKWDIVITQQVSYLSPDYKLFFPYVNDVINYLKDNTDAKIGFQQTWEYGSTFVKNDGNKFTKKDSDNMFKNIQSAYTKVAKDLNIEFILNSGEIINKATKYFSKDFHVDDGYHLNDEGCYLIGANLVKKLFKKDIKKIYVPDSLNQNDCKKYIDFVNSLK